MDEEDDKELYAEMTSEEQLTYRSAMTMDSEQDGHGQSWMAMDSELFHIAHISTIFLI